MRAFDDDGNPLPRCQECGNVCATADEASIGLCAYCRPGSAKASGTLTGDIVHSCGDCKAILTTFAELQNGLCWLCGPGSAKAQSAKQLSESKPIDVPVKGE